MEKYILVQRLQDKCLVYFNSLYSLDAILPHGERLKVNTILLQDDIDVFYKQIKELYTEKSFPKNFFYIKINSDVYIDCIYVDVLTLEELTQPLTN